MRFLSIPVVIAVVVAGLWVTGGLITNDFRLAMWLSAAWMGIAGLICLGLAVRRPALRVPVLGAYAVTAAVLGAYLGMSVFLDDEVNERVATAAPAAAATAPARAASGAAASGAPARPRPSGNVRLAAGSFRPVAHQARGEATFIELARGGRVLTLTGFEVDNGPDLRVYLVAGSARSEGEVDDVVDLGALKGNKGDQQYRVPARVDIERYATVVIWCRAFSVLFARAPTA